MRKSASEIISDLEMRIAQLENRSASRSELSSLIELIETLDSNIIKLEGSFNDWSESVSGKELSSKSSKANVEVIFNTLDKMIDMGDELAEAHRLLLKLRRSEELG